MLFDGPLGICVVLFGLSCSGEGIIKGRTVHLLHRFFFLQCSRSFNTGCIYVVFTISFFSYLYLVKNKHGLLVLLQN